MNATFAYRGWNRNNDVVAGLIRATDRADAQRSITERGIRPISVVDAGSTFRLRNWFIPKPPERIAFFRSLASLMDAGVSLTTAFGMLVEQADDALNTRARRWAPWKKRASKRFVGTLEGVRTEIVNGSRISAAMSRRPDDFTDVEVAMIAAGERAGGTERIVANLAAYLEKDRKFRKTLTSALAYPIVVSFAAGLLVLVLSFFVVPKFVEFYAAFNVALPPSLGAMLLVSKALHSPLFVLGALATVGALVYGALRSLETTKGAMAFDRMRMEIPIIGELLRKNVMVSVSNVLKMLMEAGETPVSALDTMTQITDSPLYTRAIIAARDSLADGRTANLHQALTETGAFDSFYLGYVRIGQKAGNVPEMLEKVSEHYEADIETLVGQIPLILQTILIIGVGTMVGSIIVPIYSSMVNLGSQIH